MDNKINEVLHEHLSKHDLYFDNEELSEITNAILNKYKEQQNIGVLIDRIKFNEREKAFFEQWFEDNEIRRCVNHGHGLLQDLFIDTDKFRNRTFLYIITQNDRTIVATVVQWLGTNIGFSFLERALKRCGYKIVKDE